MIEITYDSRPGPGWACTTCGALVSTQDWDRHDSWHARGEGDQPAEHEYKPMWRSGSGKCVARVSDTMFRCGQQADHPIHSGEGDRLTCTDIGHPDANPCEHPDHRDHPIHSGEGDR